MATAGFGVSVKDFEEKLGIATDLFYQTKAIYCEQVLILALRLKPEEIEKARMLTRDILAEETRLSGVNQNDEKDEPEPTEQPNLYQIQPCLLQAARRLLG